MQETLAFVDSLVNDKPTPCSGMDGLIALVMAIAAGTSADEGRWVKFSELAPQLCAISTDLPEGLSIEEVPPSPLSCPAERPHLPSCPPLRAPRAALTAPFVSGGVCAYRSLTDL